MIQKAEKSNDLEERLSNIMAYASLTIYLTVSRALFGEHKITFSFMLATAIQRNAGEIAPSEWTLMLVGAGIVDANKLPPKPEGIDQTQWELICTIGERVEGLAELPNAVSADVSAWQPRLGAEEPGRGADGRRAAVDEGPAATLCRLRTRARRRAACARPTTT